MKIGSGGIPLNYSMIILVCGSMKRAMALYKKYSIENKWSNIQVQNENTSLERY